MVNYLIKTQERFEKLSAPENNCWISMTAPTTGEVAEISQKLGLETDVVGAALDVDERSRIETDDDYTMILINIPTIETNNDKELYSTIPLSIIVAGDMVVTVCSEDAPVLRPFMENRVKGFYTKMRSRFIFQLLYRIASQYLEYLRIIDSKTNQVENRLHKSTQNHELIELLKLEKSLVYFTTALRSNEAVLEKLLRSEVVKKYEDDADLLEDVIVENKQAIEMANIYSGILSGMMDAFASVISNNLNVVMKVLAIITVVMAIPTIIFSAYGMNVNMEGMALTQSPLGFVIIVGISVVLSVVATLIFVKAKMFK